MSGGGGGQQGRQAGGVGDRRLALDPESVLTAGQSSRVPGEEWFQMCKGVRKATCRPAGKWADVGRKHGSAGARSTAGLRDQRGSVAGGAQTSAIWKRCGVVLGHKREVGRHKHNYLASAAVGTRNSGRHRRASTGAPSDAGEEVGF